MDQISESPEKMSLEGEEKEISIMFSDIRGFTTLSEKLSPTQVTMLLHDYFTPVTRSIIKNHGTLDKFIGDAVMCFWNAPLNVKEHQKLAVKTGFEMLDALVRLNLMFKDKYGIEIDIGIGIHSGRCRVGNMGSADLFDYTIIGDNVNSRFTPGGVDQVLWCENYCQWLHHRLSARCRSVPGAGSGPGKGKNRACGDLYGIPAIIGPATGT